jgi:putative intracellular protease/amidase
MRNPAVRKAVFVILDHYADWEPAFLAMALRGEMGEPFEVSYASTDRQPKTSIGGLTALLDLTLSEIPPDADALIFIGADGSWKRPQQEAAALARRFYKEGKVVAGICDAARWLGSVGLLNKLPVHARATSTARWRASAIHQGDIDRPLVIFAFHPSPALGGRRTVVISDSV